MKRGVSLLEVIVAALIIGVLAALTIPQLSRAAAAGPEPDARGGLNVLRCAIELYYDQHGEYPGQKGDGLNAAGTPEAFIRQLTQFTDGDGRVSQTKDADHPYGPYLRLGVPACVVPPRQGKTGIAIVRTAPAFAEFAPDVGWVYNCVTGDIALNSDVKDRDGVRYDEY
jgi:prepilin-type N-terminal cleavage/methylation domain-containing protein